MKITSQLLFILFSLTLTSCAWFESNPYANFSVGDINEDGPDSEATILVGDPQVISRDTLINDRDRESRHIEELIKKSKYLKFEPQILRDIKVVNAFTSQLGVGFDPSIGRSFKRAEEISSLSTDIEILKLKNQLKQLQEQINTNSTDISLKPKTDTPISAPTNTPPTVTHDALTGDTGSLKKLSKVIDSLLSTAAEKLNKNKPDKSQFNSSPEEQFEDLNAYRARLRQRQAEINLDDVHDLLGNTLYRLQLNATILPGEIKNKYGVLDFAITGSKVEEKELDRVYVNWLLSLYSRSELINNLDFSDFKNESVQVAWDNIISYFVSKGFIGQCNLTLTSGKKKNLFIAPLINNATQEDTKNRSINSNVFVQVFSNLLKNKKGQSFLSAPSKKKLGIKTADTIQECESLDITGLTPKVFKDKLTEEIDGKLHWKASNIYTYQAQPSEKVQRLSSLASAANSMQSAFALAATLPQYGLSIDAGAAASKAAVGMAEAIERTPLVIGYTDKKKSKPHFGYIFGPKAILQTDENQLVYKQIPASHSVFADISIPGWWPSLTLQTRKSWVGNWHDGSSILKPYNKIHEIDVRLRPKRQGFEALTDFLYSSAIPSISADTASIEQIFPENINVCSSAKIDLVIKGKNLWRKPKVFFLGVEQSLITILPDMEGLSVKVNLAELSMDTWDFFQEDEEIIVWTSFGKAGKINTFEAINFQGSRKDCVNGAETLKLVPDKNFYVAGTKEVNLTVNITSEIPNSIWGYKVIAQVIPENGRPNTILVSNSKATKNGSKFTGKLIISKGTIGDNDNAQLKVGLQYKTSEGGVDIQDWASKKVVFYPKLGGDNISIKTKGIMSLTKNIELMLPNRMGEAYPEFKLASAEFKLSLKDSELSGVTIPISYISQSPRTVILTVGKPTVDTAMKKLEKAWCKKDLKATISIEKKFNTAMPLITVENESDGNFTFIKNCD
jgi:hypothetical protein